jgi:SurA N-terminal domain/PPIC-type PPIASE domain
VQIRRLTAAAVAGLALAGLAGCRTAPNVAAYVGDSQVTVAELESAVDDRLADPAIAEFAGQDPDTYTRQVLSTLVQDEVHTTAAARYGVEVAPAEVRERLDEIFAGQDQDEAYASLAGQGLSRQDAFSLIRQQLVRLRIAEAEGLDDPLSDEALRDRYEQNTAEAAEIEFGYITVPDQRTADQLVAALERNPDRYAELAGRYAGDFTQAELQTLPLDQVPPPLADQAAEAEPGSAFAVPVEETGGIVVGFVGPSPSFEELRPQLRQQAEAEVDQAAQPLVQKVREDLDVVVNPRYGELQDDGQVQPADAEVVDILEG